MPVYNPLLVRVLNLPADSLLPLLLGHSTSFMQSVTILATLLLLHETYTSVIWETFDQAIMKVLRLRNGTSTTWKLGLLQLRRTYCLQLVAWAMRPSAYLLHGT